MKHLHYAVLFILSFAFLQIKAQQRIPVIKSTVLELPKKTIFSKLTRLYSSFKTISLSSRQFSDIAAKKKDFTVEIIIDKQHFILEMQPANITSSDFCVQLQTEKGIEEFKKSPDYLFKGKLKGKSGSEARAVIKDSYISLNIIEDSVDYFLEGLSKYDASATANDFIFYSSRDLKEANLRPCILSDNSQEKIASQRQYKELTSDTCLTIPVVLIADNHMYQLFNGDVEAIETRLLETVNQSQAYYTGFNFDPTLNGDVGGSNLQFKVVKIVVATCEACDPVSKSTETYFILRQLYDWLKLHPQYNGYCMINLVTPRNLYSSGVRIGGISGGGWVKYNSIVACPYFGYSILQFFPENAALNKLIIAHETGHNLGCQHDNEIKSSVKGFVMQNGAPVTATRFSTLTDFGGVNYSSNLMIRQSVLNRMACLMNCNPSPCDTVTDIKVNSLENDSIVVSWNETTSLIARLSQENVNGDSMIWEKSVQGRQLSFGPLLSCTKYLINIEPSCPSGTSKSSALRFQTYSNSVKQIDTFSRTMMYDAKLLLNKNFNGRLQVFLDQKEIAFERTESSIFIKDLLADGKKHKVEFKDTMNINCLATVFYNAPDARKNATTLLKADFNDCNLPPVWQDSISRMIPSSFTFMKWNSSGFSFPTTSFQVGTFDSSCFLFYQPYTAVNGCCGGLILTSPAIDITHYKNVELQFDHLFIGFTNTNRVSSFLNVQVYDGKEWKKIWERTNDALRPPRTFFMNIWDTIPERIHLRIDPYINAKFKIRFHTDDGWYYDSLNHLQSDFFYVALDNIKMDGYPVDSLNSSQNHVVVFPNPAMDILFLQFKRPPIGIVSFQIYNINGTRVQQGQTNDFKIRLRNISSGMYLLRLNENNTPTKTVKFIIIR